MSLQLFSVNGDRTVSRNGSSNRSETVLCKGKWAVRVLCKARVLYVLLRSDVPNVLIRNQLLQFVVCISFTLKACPHWTKIQFTLNPDPLNAHSIYIDRVHAAK